MDNTKKTTKNIFEFKVGKQDGIVEKIRCEICGYEFYNVKFLNKEYFKLIKKMQQQERDIEKGKIIENLPKGLDKNLNQHIEVLKCPNCSASYKRLEHVMTKKERLEKKRKEAIEKEEKENPDEDKKIIKEVCDYIYSECIMTMSTLQKQLYKGKINEKFFRELLLKKMRRIINISKKQYNPSKYYRKFMRDTMVYFSEKIEKEYGLYKEEIEETQKEFEEEGYRKNAIKPIKKGLKKEAKKELKFEVRKDKRYKRKSINRELK